MNRNELRSMIIILLFLFGGVLLGMAIALQNKINLFLFGSFLAIIGAVLSLHRISEQEIKDKVDLILLRKGKLGELK